MEPLTFPCPYCGGFIQAGVDNLLEMGFHCTRCKNEIQPHQIFDGERLSFTDVMARHIAEAACNYYRLWMRELAYFKAHGVRDRGASTLQVRFHMEMMRRISQFVGDNWQEMGLEEVSNLFGEDASDEPVSGMELLRREGGNSGQH